jgi:5-methylcytosine-specific restriction endonuclease McrA
MSKLKRCLACGISKARDQFRMLPSGRPYRNCSACHRPHTQAAHPRAYYKSAAYKRDRRARLSDGERAALVAKDGLRVKSYIYAHPEKAAMWRASRRERAAAASDGSLTTAVMAAILASRSTCPYCLRRITPGTAHIDHIIPLARGGLHGTVNLVPCCPGCNQRKADRSFSEWLLLLEGQCRASATALYEHRYGSVRQGMLI